MQTLQHNVWWQVTTLHQFCNEIMSRCVSVHLKNEKDKQTGKFIGPFSGLQWWGGYKITVLARPGSGPFPLSPRFSPNPIHTQCFCRVIQGTPFKMWQIDMQTTLKTFFVSKLTIYLPLKKASAFRLLFWEGGGTSSSWNEDKISTSYNPFL